VPLEWNYVIPAIPFAWRFFSALFLGEHARIRDGKVNSKIQGADLLLMTATRLRMALEFLKRTPSYSLGRGLGRVRMGGAPKKREYGVHNANQDFDGDHAERFCARNSGIVGACTKCEHACERKPGIPA
jgi:hypothetical protein